MMIPGPWCNCVIVFLGFFYPETCMLRFLRAVTLGITFRKVCPSSTVLLGFSNQTYHQSDCVGSIKFFLFFWYWSLNSGLHHEPPAPTVYWVDLNEDTNAAGVIYDNRLAGVQFMSCLALEKGLRPLSQAWYCGSWTMKGTQDKCGYFKDSI
jgi:hypothetical protein